MVLHGELPQGYITNLLAQTHLEHRKLFYKDYHPLYKKDCRVWIYIRIWEGTQKRLKARLWGFRV